MVARERTKSKLSDDFVVEFSRAFFCRLAFLPRMTDD